MSERNSFQQAPLFSLSLLLSFLGLLSLSNINHWASEDTSFPQRTISTGLYSQDTFPKCVMQLQQELHQFLMATMYSWRAVSALSKAHDKALHRGTSTELSLLRSLISSILMLLFPYPQKYLFKWLFFLSALPGNLILLEKFYLSLVTSVSEALLTFAWPLEKHPWTNS